jgi:lysozyme family protein
MSADRDAQRPSDFERCLAFVLRWEGGYSNNPADRGGETNWGISKRAYPNVDIASLTREEAAAIYHSDYWLASGADKLAWPLNLLVFDAAVNCGVGQALAFRGNTFAETIANRIEWYTKIRDFGLFGPAWMRRCADLIRESVKD